MYQFIEAFIVGQFLYLLPRSLELHLYSPWKAMKRDLNVLIVTLVEIR